MNPAQLGTGILGWIASILFTGASALLLARRLRTGRSSLDAAVALFLWIWVTTLFTFVLGLAGLLAAIPLGVLSAAGLASLLAVRASRQALREEWHNLRLTGVRLAGVWRGLPRWMRWLTAGFLAFEVIRLTILIWALPPFVWDSLTYHLTNVAQWIQDGRIALLEAPVDRIYSPANYEVLAAWFAVFLHHDVVIEAAGLPAYALAGLSVYALTRGLRVSPFGAWAATLAYLSTPALVYAATGTKNDPFVAAAFLLMAALIVHLRDSLDESETVAVGAYLVVLALAATYALGTKIYIAQLSLGLLVLLLAPGYRQTWKTHWARAKAALAAELRGASNAGRVLVVGLLVAGVVLGGYWNARNWALKGNPFFPYDIEIETEALPGTGSGHYGLGWARLGANLQVLVEKFGDKESRIVPDLPETTGWGWIAYGLGLVACVWALVCDRRFRFVAIGFAVSMLLLMASNTTSRWNMRYFIWLPALLSVGLGIFVDPLPAMDAARRRLLGGLFGFALAMNAVMTVNYNLVTMEDLGRMLSLPVRQRDSGRFHMRSPVEYEHAYTYVPGDAVLGYNVHQNGFIYPLYRADFSQRLVYIPLSEADTCEAIAEAMEAHGTRYLFVAPEHSDDELIRHLRACAASPSPIRERASGLYVVKRDGE